MSSNRQILLGCDDTAELFAVLNLLKKHTAVPWQVITATSNADLLAIARSVAPQLIILCFRGLQQALDAWAPQAGRAPVLCITRLPEHRRLQWADDQIVFTCTSDQARQGICLQRTINSILLMNSGQAVPQQHGSFADAAIQSGASRNMSRMVLELDQKVELLNKVRDRLAKISSRTAGPVRNELMQVVNSIKNSMNDQKLWEDFKLYFVKTNPDFLTRLSEKYPSLTEVDLKYCCYLKMNMSNDDIRCLLGINQESVRTHKYRLKKKLSLMRDESLRGFLHTIK